MKGAAIRIIVGGRSSSYEQELVQARANALQDFSDRAGALGADAIVGIDIDYEMM